MNYQDLLKNYKDYLITHKEGLAYYNFLHVLFPFLEKNNIELDTITQDTFTQFLKEHPDYTTETLNLYIKAVRHFYKRYLGKDCPVIFTSTKLAKVDRKIKAYITEEELNKVLSYLISENDLRMLPIKVKAIAYTLFYTGARKAEFLRFKREDFDLETKRAIIRTPTKGKKEKIIICLDRLVKVLKEYFISEPENRNAFNFSALQLENFVRKMNKYLHNKHITPHSLRHSYAKNMIAKGVPIETVSKQLGHSSIATTLIYTDPDLEMQEKVIRDRMEQK
jgi:integrase/recombinase XerD